ncbi:ATP-binding protein [Paenibacillus sp.]|uniref:sensor histidine kinase n=1 Tax=Paenibacillus sp. TaxID=58172 RepID=UPI002812436D|nr:ATP-binding protein [Paenibacillus sp.]
MSGGGGARGEARGGGGARRRRERFTGMSVRRQLFIAMASMVVGMALVFSFISHVVQSDLLDVMVEAPRKERVASLSAAFEEAYAQGGGSWGTDPDDAPSEALAAAASLLTPAESVALLSLRRDVRFEAGPVEARTVTDFGIRSVLFDADRQAIGFLYFYDDEVGELSRLRTGLLHSTRTLLLFAVVIFTAIALAVAFWKARWLTQPLTTLLEAIDRLGSGDLDARAPVTRRGEFGRVAEAFNAMTERLQRTEEARRHLVADVAHELRTPLTILRGQLDAAQQRGEPLAPERLLPLQDELIRLTRLVDELHQLSLAEAKRLPLERTPTDLHALLGRVVERVAPDAEAKGVTVTLQRLTDDAVLSVDPHRLTQVFLNLFVNAVRYTPSGGFVKAYVDETTAEGVRALRVTVSDTGPGIASEQLPYIFDRFYRTDEARNRDGGGMGLGLAIVKEFVSAHGGAISVASEPGRGTVFAVTLPYEAGNEAV